jgi:iron complex outermembrane recepter protein
VIDARLFALFLLPAVAWPQRVGSPTGDLDQLSVDELFSLEVTSVGRKAQKLSTAPAAVFVLTADDIRRSGATSIPEALRLVPGVTVLRQDGRRFGISIRGSERIYANKILVMIDGRSLYTPLFSGTLWDAIDVPLEDIERIEIVRGPGAVMWGPNAMNGVINIITRDAWAAKGLAVSGAAGNELRGSGTVRWAGASGDRLAWRAWGKAEYRAPGFDSAGYFLNRPFAFRDPRVNDLDAASGRLGFRFDGRSGERDRWMVQGDLSRIHSHDEVAYPKFLPDVSRSQANTRYQTGFLQGQWTHSVASGESTLQFSYDRYGISYPFVGGATNNLTVDFQTRRRWGERHEIYWGAGYQQYWDRMSSGAGAMFNPPEYVFRGGDTVVRDEWQLVPGRLMASAGIRLDYNVYRRLEYQPSVRLLYTPDSQRSVWIAVSRAVRVPDRLDRDLAFDRGLVDTGILPMRLRIEGSKDMRSEIARSVEIGYRRQSGQRWSVDTTLFATGYDRLRAVASPTMPSLVFSGGMLLLQLNNTMTNRGSGHSFGGEAAGTFQVRPGWRLLPSYSYVREILKLPPDGPAVMWGFDRDPSDLRHQGVLRSQHDLTRSVQLDFSARARSRDRGFGTAGALFLDARISWRPIRSGEISVAVENLANRQVVEIYPEILFCSIPTRRLFSIRWTERF